MSNKRTQHKTMRITPEALQYIKGFEGNTFNDKINNMIEFFMNTENDLREKKVSIEKDVEKSKLRLKKIKDLLRDINIETY